MENNNDYKILKRELTEELSNHISDLGYFLKRKNIKSFIDRYYYINRSIPSKEDSLRVLLKHKYLRTLKVYGCSGKVGHKNKKEANQAKSIMQKRYEIDFFIYKCKTCKEYHLTKKLLKAQ